MVERLAHRLVAAAALAAVVFVATVPPASAGKDCECIADGRRVKEGEVVCLRAGSSDAYLARCEMVLNNTSWKKLQDGCPTTMIDDAATAMPVAVDIN